MYMYIYAHLCTYTTLFVALVAACLHCVEKKRTFKLTPLKLTFNARGPAV